LVVALLLGWFVCAVVRRILSFISVSSLDKKSVLITGCDTGFGRSLSSRLYGRGLKVFAACLTPKGVEELKAAHPTPKMVPFLMDVTNDESVEKGFQFVVNNLSESGEKDGLWAIVNNAGVLRGGPLELCELKDWKFCLEVNVLGIARVSRRFFSLLRQNPKKEREAGRIVNVASVAGRLSLPGTGCYSASKFAVQGLSDAWRREGWVWDVGVVIIEPGIMKTNLYDQPFSRERNEEMYNQLDPEVRDLFGKEYLEKSLEDFRKLVQDIGGDPERVVDGMEVAVCSRFPPSRMAIGNDTWAWLGISYLPTWLSDILLKLAFSKNLPAGSPHRK